MGRGLFYWLAFITLLAGCILAIIALLYDNLTKFTIDTAFSKSKTQYCGWYNIHDDSASIRSHDDRNIYAYVSNCDKSQAACKMERVGKAWYSLLIIGIVFSGIALICFILDFWVPFAFSITTLSNVLFFGCMLAAVLTWGIAKACHKACDRLFDGIPIKLADCYSVEWGMSWILAVIAGGLSLVSILSLIVYRSVSYKH